MGFILSIYFIGFFVVYYSIRYIAKRDNDWTWSSFGYALGYAFGSWLSVFFIILIFLWEYIKNIIKKQEPPKWL